MERNPWTVQTTTDSPKQLPRDPQTLAFLLERVQTVLDYLERGYQQQQIRLRAIRDAVSAPASLLQQRPRLAVVGAEAIKHHANGGPASTVLQHYLDQDRLAGLLDCYNAAKAGLKNTPPKGNTTAAALEHRGAALATLVSAEAAIIQFFRDLQWEILRALDADSADRKADKSRGRWPKIPANHRVLDLARLINTQTDQHKSQMDIAKELTNGNLKEANGLLRQLRRFRHLLTA